MVELYDVDHGNWGHVIDLIQGDLDKRFYGEIMYFWGIDYLPGKEILAGPKPNFCPLWRFLILTRPLDRPLCRPWLLTVVTHFQSSWAPRWLKKVPLFRWGRARSVKGGGRSGFGLSRSGLYRVKILEGAIEDNAPRMADKKLIIFFRLFLIQFLKKKTQNESQLVEKNLQNSISSARMFLKYFLS